MPRRNKLAKFSDIRSFPNVVENYDPKTRILTWKEDEEANLQGNWANTFFANDKPITLELACGRGEYTLALGRTNPETNFIGVDIKGARIWKGAKIALHEGLTNVGFLRTRIEQIDYFFAPNEVSEIWITFPDPFADKENRRLVAPSFLERYKRFLKPGGIVHLKTDDTPYYEYALEIVQNYEGAKVLYANNDIYAQPLDYTYLEHKTYYEVQHLGKGRTIKYLMFQLH